MKNYSNWAIHHKAYLLLIEDRSKRLLTKLYIFCYLKRYITSSLHCYLTSTIYATILDKHMAKGQLVLGVPVKISIVQIQQCISVPQQKDYTYQMQNTNSVWVRTLPLRHNPIMSKEPVLPVRFSKLSQCCFTDFLESTFSSLGTDKRFKLIYKQLGKVIEYHRTCTSVGAS